jgi:hypothetical protein
MDLFHRAVLIESPSGRPCQFCKSRDPEFSRRSSSDQMVRDRDTACAHITENGHVRHRLLELRGKLAEKTPSLPQMVA